MADHSPETLSALERVARIFDAGCDRCCGLDLALLEGAGLMEQGVCTDTFGQDTLELGESMWSFTPEGQALAARCASGDESKTECGFLRLLAAAC